MTSRIACSAVLKQWSFSHHISMEGKRSKCSLSASSSLVSELFGNKDSTGNNKSSSSSSSSSSGILGSIFPPTPSFAGKDSSRSNSKKSPSSGGSTTGRGRNGCQNKEKNSTAGCANKMDPCFLSSSVYYGGQDFCSHPNSDPNSFAFSYDRQHHQYRKEGGNESEPIDSRGDWWQGSLYY